MNRRWLLRGFGVVAALAAVAVSLRIGESHSSEIQVRDPTAWLLHRKTGEAVQVNSATGGLVRRLAVGSAGDDLTLVQSRSGAFLLDRTKGEVKFIDGATLKVAHQAPVPADPAGQILSVGDQLRVVSGNKVTAFDTRTGTPSSDAVDIGAPVTTAALLPDGRFIGRGADAIAVQLAAATTQVKVPGSVSALLGGRGRAWAYDSASGALRVVNDNGSLGKRSCSTVAVAAVIGTRSSTDSVVAVIDPKSGTLLVSGARCVTATHPELVGASSAPVAVGNHVFVPSAERGEVDVFRADDASLLRRIPVAPAGRSFELFAKDGIVWVNDPLGGAAVVNENRVVVEIDKERGGSGPVSPAGTGLSRGAGSGGAGSETGRGAGTAAGVGSGNPTGAGPGVDAPGGGTGTGGSTTGNGSGGGDDEESLPPGVLRADFEFSARVVNVDEAVTFTDRSAGGPTAWTWDFGDNTFASGPRTSHAWKQAGSYTVTLRVDNATTTSRATATILVKAPEAKVKPRADFRVSSQRVEVGAPVTFTSTSTGNPTELRWSFGDGTSAVGATQTKSWASPGIYLVTLTATNAAGSDTTNPPLPITVFDRVEQPAARIETSAREATVGQTIIFTSRSTGNPTELRWTWGDNTPTSQGVTARHAWTAPGTYTVTLFVANSAGSSTATQQVTIVEPVFTPEARIAVSATTVAENEAVRFTSTSINRPTSVLWAFGDGTGSTQASVSKAWARAGTYTVTLTATNSAGDNTATVTITVLPVIPQPVANFEVRTLAADTATPVVFEDRSTNATEWLWDFGDGTTSAQQNPTHLFSRPGTFQVRLTVTNRAGSNAIVKPVIVRNPAPQAAFAFVPATPQAGAVVTFTDTSTGGPATSWAWTFGDGGTSVLRNPTHTFVAPGTFTVRLTVSNESGSTSVVRSVVVSPPPPVAGFTFLPAAPVVGAPVTFTNTSTGGTGTTFLWEFGDGTTAAVENPTKTFTASGTYTVRFTVTNISGTSSVTRSVTVAIPAPVASFTVSAGSVAIGEQVVFTNTSTGGAPTTVLWSFGDGTTSALVTPPPKSWAAPGTYVVRLTLTNPSGTSTAVRNITVTATPLTAAIAITTPAPPGPWYTTRPVTFVGSAAGGVAPYTYAWAFPTGTPATGAGPTATTTYATAAPPTKTITLTVTDGAGTTATATLSLTVTPLPPAPAVTLTLAPLPPVGGYTGPIAITATAAVTPGTGVGPFTYAWTLNGVPVPAAAAATLTRTYAAAAGAQTLVVTVTDAFGRAGTATVSFVVN